MYLLQDNLLFGDINYSGAFFAMVLSLFTRVLKTIHSAKSTVYFTMLIAAIHYLQRAVFASRKFYRYCVSLKKAIAFLLF